MSQPLEKEFDGLADVAKTTLSQTLSWYTFFTGINLVAYGWFAGHLSTGNSGVRYTLLIVAIHFCIQHVFGYIALTKVGRVFKKMQGRMDVLNLELQKLHKPTIQSHVFVPFDEYMQIILLLRHTLPSMALLWVAFTVYAFMR